MKVHYKVYVWLALFLFPVFIFAQTTNFTRIDINTTGAGGANSSSPRQLTPLGSTLYFTADNGVNGRELWKSDGTQAGTVIVADIKQSPTIASSSDPLELTVFNGTLYFSAVNDFGVRQLFRLNTVSGLPEAISGAFNPSNLTVVGNELFLAAETSTPNSAELYKVNSSGNFVLVSDINPTGNSNPSELININGVLYFSANDGTSGVELWKHDPVAGTTTLAADINTGAGDSNPTNLTNVNGVLYFSATSDGTDIELFRHDPAGAAGNFTEIEVNATGSSNPAELTNVNGVLYFSARDGSIAQPELFRILSSASTTASKVGGGMLTPVNLTNVNGTLYFSAFDLSVTPFGGELFKVTSSVTNAVLVETTAPNAPTSSKEPTSPTPFSVRTFAAVGNKLLFAANREDDATGPEIWQTDGTEAGTLFGQDIQPGATGSDPENITPVGTKVFLTATTTANGTELYVDATTFLGTLPLTFLEVKGRLVQNNGLIEWKTANETNTASFIIERSIDGRNYKAIGSVAAAGTSGTKNYQFTDAGITSLGASVVYYRIQQKDVDGKASYSRIISLPVSSKTVMVHLYPNPVKNEASLMINLIQADRLQWKILDNAGRTVKQNSRQLSAGSTTIDIDVKGLLKGVYYLQLQSASVQKQIQFVKE